MLQSVFFLVGCSNSKSSLIEEDFRNIKYGMKTEEIKRKFGNPNKIITDSKKIEEAIQYDADISSDRWDSESPDLYKTFYGSDKKMQKAFNLLEQGTNIKCFEYNYKKNRNSIKQRIWHIYFYDGKVISMFFP